MKLTVEDLALLKEGLKTLAEQNETSDSDSRARDFMLNVLNLPEQSVDEGIKERQAEQRVKIRHINRLVVFLDEIEAKLEGNPDLDISTWEFINSIDVE